MAKGPSNIAASVRQRLLNLARKEQRAFDVVLVAFGLERVTYRLSVTGHRDRFVLKGGMLFTLWTTDPGRFTRDVDFLGFGDDDQEQLKAAFAEILAIDAGDGLIFDTAEISATEIREDQVYGGKRLKTTAYLGKARIPSTIVLGFAARCAVFNELFERLCAVSQLRLYYERRAVLDGARLRDERETVQAAAL